MKIIRFLTLLLFVSLAACRGREVPATATVANDEIRIGHYGSLSGAQATFGQSTDNGIRLAVG
jgi:branched-chain amino acid transport system substrate-binding protein